MIRCTSSLSCGLASSLVTITAWLISNKNNDEREEDNDYLLYEILLQ